MESGRSIEASRLPRSRIRRTDPAVRLRNPDIAWNRIDALAATRVPYGVRIPRRRSPPRPLPPRRAFLSLEPTIPLEFLEHATVFAAKQSHGTRVYWRKIEGERMYTSHSCLFTLYTTCKRHAFLCFEF